MRFVLAVVFTTILALLFHQFLPWWAIVPGGFLTGIAIKIRPFIMFLAGMLGGIILWGGMALMLDSGNEGILSGRIGELFGNIGSVGIIVVTAVFGGIMAGLGGLTGGYLRQLFEKN